MFLSRLFLIGYFFWVFIAPLSSTVLARDFEGFSLDIPDGWLEMDRPDSAVKVLLQSPDGEQLFLIIAVPHGNDKGKTEREFLAGMRDSLGAQGLEMRKTGDRIVGGTNFQTFRVDMGENGEREVYLSNDGKSVFAVHLVGNPIGAESREVLESLRPQGGTGTGTDPGGGSGSGGGEGWQPDKNSDSYKLGVLSGRISIIVLIGAAVATCVIGIIKKRRRQ
jgi:hypothetical protein